MAFAILILSAFLAGFAIISLRYQLRNWRRLRSETLASDDRRYLRGVCQRRSLNAVLLLALAGLLAGAYLSGGLADLTRIAAMDPQDRTDEDRETVKSLAIYWIVVLVILFFVIVIAMGDYVAVGLYGRQQLRRIQHEQRDLLERDLAVYRQQKLNDRMRRPG
jgi:cytochrome c-type biogenesis protein CcmH/NrfG